MVLRGIKQPRKVRERSSARWLYKLIDSFIAISRPRYVENVELEALKAIARWSVIGKVVSFQVAFKAVE